MKIGLLPMAGKPVHAGHWGLIEIASKENDLVYLFVSTSDRKRAGEMTITGDAMLQVWKKFLEPALPGNVTPEYGGVPVGNVYKKLEEAESSKSADVFTIYSDSEDILKYTSASLKKSAPRLMSQDQIMLRGVNRNETVNVSGTRIRELLSTGDFKSFSNFLPPPVQRNAKQIMNVLLGKRTTKSESLLRDYIRYILV